MRIAAAFIAVAALAGCAAQTADRPGTASRLSFDLNWAGVGPCENRSPGLTLFGAPDAARRVRLTIVAAGTMLRDRVGGEVAWDGRSPIAPGAMAGYRAPCPPREQVFEFIVVALGADGAVLAEGRREIRLPLRLTGPGQIRR